MMRKMETQLYHGSHSMDALDVHQAMTIVKPGAASFPSTVEISPATARKLCSVISAYRLMDIMYALQSLPSPFQNLRYGKLPQQGLVPDGKVSTPSRLRLRGPKTLWSELAVGGRPEQLRGVGKVPHVAIPCSWHIYGLSRCRYPQFYTAGSPVQGFAWVQKTSKRIEHALQLTGRSFPPVLHAERTYCK